MSMTYDFKVKECLECWRGHHCGQREGGPTTMDPLLPLRNFCCLTAAACHLLNASSNSHLTTSPTTPPGRSSETSSPAIPTAISRTDTVATSSSSTLSLDDPLATSSVLHVRESSITFTLPCTSTSTSGSSNLPSPSSLPTRGAHVYPDPWIPVRRHFSIVRAAPDFEALDEVACWQRPLPHLLDPSLPGYAIGLRVVEFALVPVEAYALQQPERGEGDDKAPDEWRLTEAPLVDRLNHVGCYPFHFTGGMDKSNISVSYEKFMASLERLLFQNAPKSLTSPLRRTIMLQTSTDDKVGSDGSPLLSGAASCSQSSDRIDSPLAEGTVIAEDASETCSTRRAALRILGTWPQDAGPGEEVRGLSCTGQPLRSEYSESPRSEYVSASLVKQPIVAVWGKSPKSRKRRTHRRHRELDPGTPGSREQQTPSLQSSSSSFRSSSDLSFSLSSCFHPLDWFVLRHDILPPSAVRVFRFSFEWLMCSSPILQKTLRRVRSIAREHNFVLLQLPAAQLTPPQCREQSTIPTHDGRQVRGGDNEQRNEVVGCCTSPSLPVAEQCCGPVPFQPPISFALPLVSRVSPCPNLLQKLLNYSGCQRQSSVDSFPSSASSSSAHPFDFLPTLLQRVDSSYASLCPPARILVPKFSLRRCGFEDSTVFDSCGVSSPSSPCRVPSHVRLGPLESDFYRVLIYVLLRPPLSLLFLLHVPSDLVRGGWWLMERHGLYYVHIARKRVCLHLHYLQRRWSNKVPEYVPLLACECADRIVDLDWRMSKISNEVSVFSNIVLEVALSFAPWSAECTCSAAHGASPIRPSSSN